MFKFALATISSTVVSLIAILLLVTAGISGLTAAVHAQGPPSMPQIFYGQVTLSGSPAPTGVSIVAKVGGTQFGSTTTDSTGKYGVNPVFVVSPTSTGVAIDFYINGSKADQSVPYSPGSRTEVNLSIGSTTPPSTSCGLTTASLPSGTVGSAYSAGLTASGGTLPYTWSVTSGTLPAGLTLTSASGVISGTPTTAQTYNFTVQANDSAAHVCSKALAIMVSSAAATQAVVTISSNILGAPDTFSLSNGTISNAKDLASADGRVKLSLAAGTSINMQGLTQLGAATESNPPGATDNSTMIRSYSFVPSGATFSPAAILTLKYETASLPSGSSESNLYIAWWTGSTWERISSAVNASAKEVSAPVSHFTVFSLRYLPSTASTTTASSPTTTTTTTITPANQTTIATNVLGTSSSLSISGGSVSSPTSLGSANGKLSISLAANTAVSLPTGSQQVTVIQLASPPAAPEGARMVEAYAFGPDNATFSPALTVTVKYDTASLPPDVTEANLYIALLENSAWTPLASSVNTQVKTVTAQVSHFSIYSLLGKVVAAAVTPTTPAATAAFSYSDLTVSPASASPGEQVVASVRVVNGGTGEASKTVILKINSQVQEQKEVKLSPGKSQVVSFNLSKSEPGEYAVSVDGQSTSFTVKESAKTPDGMSIPVLAVIIAGGLLIIVLVIILVMRQRSGGY